MEVPKKKITLSGLKNALKLYSYIKPYRVIYILGLFFLFGSSVTNLAFPKLLGKTLDNLYSILYNNYSTVNGREILMGKVTGTGEEYTRCCL